jgi:hypothetical protein
MTLIIDLTRIINYVELLRRFGDYILRSLKALNVKLLMFSPNTIL